MKIVIIKSFADDYDCDLLQTDEDINPLSYALTKSDMSITASTRSSTF